MINILGHFFEMSKPDAERAMEIYRTFARQTDFVVQYLQVARQYEHHTRVEIPKLKHAPVNLGRQLEDYLKDSDFEVHRRQYLAEMDVKKSGGSGSKTGKGDAATTGKMFPDSNPSTTITATSKSPAATKGPAPDLIDFFDSIEQNQQTMAANPQQQQQQQQQQQFAQTDLGNPWASNSPFDQVAQQMGQPFQGNEAMPQQSDQQFQSNGFAAQPTGFVTQPTGFVNNSPFQQQNVGVFNPQQQPQQQQQQATQQQVQQSAFTGTSFGGFSQQQGGFTPGGLSPIPQNSVASFQTGGLSPPMQTGLQPGQQTTNPFRQSMLMANATGVANPVPAFNSTTSPQPATQLQRQSTNPFARLSSVPLSGQTAPSPFQPQQAPPAFQPQQPQATVPQPLQPMQTGTNPFAKNFGGSAGQQLQRPQTSGALMPQPTGSTNPFRQGDFMNHQTGQGWQHNQGRIGGGFDEIQSTPIFPRPSTGTAWQT